MGTPVSQDRHAPGRIQREAPNTSPPPGDRPSPVRGASHAQGLVAIVGSANPVKVAATRQAFAEVYGDAVAIDTTTVPSGVSDQPMTTEETLRGAINRADRARRTRDAEFGVGLEGGLTEVAGRWYCIGWTAITDWAGGVWSAPTAGTPVPSDVMNLILGEGMELGDAEDKVFGRINSKQNGGLIGIITDERVSRMDNFLQPLLVAVCAMRIDLEGRHEW